MEGTGQEAFNQPLGNLAALTATREVLPVGEIGAGVKVRLANHLLLRVQARDYISQAPHEVIALGARRQVEWDPPGHRRHGRYCCDLVSQTGAPSSL